MQIVASHDVGKSVTPKRCARAFSSIFRINSLRIKAKQPTECDPMLERTRRAQSDAGSKYVNHIRLLQHCSSYSQSSNAQLFSFVRQLECIEAHRNVCSFDLRGSCLSFAIQRHHDAIIAKTSPYETKSTLVVGLIRALPLEITYSKLGSCRRSLNENQ